MSLQRILNLAESISFNRRRVIGLQYSRNEIAFRSETPTRNPWRMTVKVAAPIPYADARGIIEDLDKSDRSDVELVTFSNNANMSFMLQYQGVMNLGQQNAITVQSFTGTNLVLGGLPDSGGAAVPEAVIFKKGDFIQIEDKPYPFTVENDVVRGSGSTVTVVTHRPNFFASSVVGSNILLGNRVNFQVICTNMPTYTLSPGGRNAIVTFDSDFELYEFTGLES